MYSILICDDDCDSLRYLEHCIKDLDYGCIAWIKTFNTAEKLLFYLEEEQSQVPIFVLDIEINAYSGIDLAKEIHAKYHHAQIIFVSGFDEYFVDVYQVEHLYFLQKPVEPLKLKDALNKAIRNVKTMAQTMIVVNNQKGIFRVALDDIFYVEKSKRLIRLFLGAEQEEVSFYGKIEEIEGRLTSDFVRCHHSYFVNLDKVTRLEGMQARLSSGALVPISQTKYKLTREAFLAYLARKIENGEVKP